MMRYLRWQGGLAFIAVISCLLLVLLWLAPSLVKYSLEKAGGWYFGAQVDVQSVAIEYQPLTLTLNNLEITNNSNPQINAISVKQATAQVQWWQYLLGHIIIDELAVDGLRFNSPRAVAGEIYRPSESSLVDHTQQQLLEQLPAIDLSLPDVQTLLANSDLITVKASEQLSQVYQHEKQSIQALTEQLPDKSRLTYYQVEVKKLVDSDVKSVDDVRRLQQQLVQLKQQITQDQNTVKQAKAQLNSSKLALSDATKAVKMAPEQDWQRLKSVYQLDNLDKGDFVHMLFGAKARTYYQTVEQLYHQVAPFVGGSKQQSAQSDVRNDIGQFIHFETANRLPSWLVKRAAISVELEQGDFDVSINELTSEHWLRNKPTQLIVNSHNLLKTGDAKLQADIFNGQQNLNVLANYAFNKLSLTNIALREQANLSLLLEQAMMAGQGQFKLNQQQLENNSAFSFDNVRYTGSANNKLAETLLTVLTKVDKFDASIALNGALNDPQWQVDSSLNDLFARAMNQQLQGQLSRFQHSVESGLRDKTANALNLSEQQMASLTDLDSVLNDTEKTLTNLLQAKITASKKKQLEDKLKKKLGDILQ